MTKQERSLLIYLETCSVDNRGKIDPRRLNDDDIEILKEWEDYKFIKFGRVKTVDIKDHCCSWIILSDKAWEVAHDERKARAERMGQYGHQ